MVRVNRLDAGDSTVCRHCGRHVSERFAAVFGDRDDRVHRCQDCDSMPRIVRGSAAGATVDSRVDPEDEPSRARGDVATHGGELR